MPPFVRQKFPSQGLSFRLYAPPEKARDLQLIAGSIYLETHAFRFSFLTYQPAFDSESVPNLAVDFRVFCPGFGHSTRTQSRHSFVTDVQPRRAS